MFMGSKASAFFLFLSLSLSPTLTCIFQKDKIWEEEGSGDQFSFQHLVLREKSKEREYFGV